MIRTDVLERNNLRYSCHSLETSARYLQRVLDFLNLVLKIAHVRMVFSLALQLGLQLGRQFGELRLELADNRVT